MKLFLTTLLLLSLASTSFASDQNQIIQEAAKIGIAADVVAKVAKKESGFIASLINQNSNIIK